MSLRPVISPRASPALWFAPLVFLLILYAWWSILSGTFPDPYLTAYVAHADDGLGYGLPIAAGGAAWAARRARRSVVGRWAAVIRSPLRIFWAHTWPLFASVGLAVLVTVVIEIARLAPGPGVPNLWLLVTYLGMATVAIGGGWLIGLIMPLPISLPLAIFAAFEWVTYPLLDGANVSWRNIAGYDLFTCCDAVNLQPDPRALIAPLIVALGILGAIWLAARLTWLLAAATSVGALGAAVVLSLIVATGTNAYGGELRPAAALNCIDSAPTVCLFPEQLDTEDVARIAKTVHTAAAIGITHGVPLPDEIDARNANSRSDSAALPVDLLSGMSSEQVIASLATSLYESNRCRSSVEVRSTLGRDVVVPYVLAQELGGSKYGVVPSISFQQGETPGAAITNLTPKQIVEKLGVSSAAQRQAILNQWKQSQANCMKGKRN